MPWRTLCGFPPNQDPITLLIPNGRWRPDTVVTDRDGNEFFVILDLQNSMGSYEAVFGDLDGRRLVCVKRHVCRQFWRDGYYFCTYYKNYPGQRALAEPDREGKKVYPFSYLEVHPLKGMFLYRVFDDLEQLREPRLVGQNAWLGFMLACCTPMLRFGNFSCLFHKAHNSKTVLEIDQWSNTLVIGPGNDMLAALCIAYVFDKGKCQPLVTVVGRDDDDELEDPDDASAGGGDYDFYEDQAAQARAASQKNKNSGEQQPPRGADGSKRDGTERELDEPSRGSVSVRGDEVPAHRTGSVASSTRQRREQQDGSVASSTRHREGQPLQPQQQQHQAPLDPYLMDDDDDDDDNVGNYDNTIYQKYHSDDDDIDDENDHLSRASSTRSRPSLFRGNASVSGSVASRQSQRRGAKPATTTDTYQPVEQAELV